MLTWLCAAVSIFRPIGFSDSIPPIAFANGQLLAERKEPLDRTLQGSREVLGRWFDGRVHREADYAVWVSPDALAGWYGYLSSRDVWTKEAALNRWKVARQDLKGKIVFIVRLAAFPREDPLDFGTEKDADPAVLKNMSFRLSYRPEHKDRYAKKGPDQDGDFVLQPDGSYAASTKGSLEADVEKRESGDILNTPFFHLSSVSKYFLAESETDDPDDGIPLGDYYGAVYRLEFTAPKTLNMCRSMKLEVIRPHKVATANFSLLEEIPDHKKPDPWAHSKVIAAGGAN